MAKTKGISESKTTSKKKQENTKGKAPPKKRIPKPKEDNILQPLFKKHCSYCGKPSTHAQRLIAGPPPLFPYICDECVEVCVRVLMEVGLQDWRSRIFSILAIQAETKQVSPKESETKPRNNKKAVKSNA